MYLLLDLGMNVNRNSQRDDSPPASPQFLARTPTLTGRQYAPIAPVAFNRRPGILPVTPSITYANVSVISIFEYFSPLLNYY